MKFKEERINLKRMIDLEAKMICPHCSKIIEQPDYRCDVCQKEYAYYIPIESNE